MHEIEGLGREHALAYYRRFYTPENAILVVAGDVAPGDIRRLAETTYGQVAPHGETLLRQRPREPDPKATRRVAVADPRVEQTTLQRLYLTPSSRTAAGREAHALDLLAEVLGGGPTSYLYRKLVLERASAVNAGSWYMSSAIDDSRFSLYGVPAEGTEIEALERDIDAALASAPAEAFAPEAIARAKTRLIAETVYSNDSQSSLARIYGSALAIGETLDDVRRWPAEIEALTRDDLVQVAERYLTPPRSVTGHLLKAGA
jgi:zinc protease